MPNSNYPSSGGGGTPGGSTTQVQYNNAGAFGGFGAWDGTNFAIGTKDGDMAPGLGVQVAGGATDSAGLISVGAVYHATSPGSNPIVYVTGYNAGAGTVNLIRSHYIDLENYGGGTTTEFQGPYINFANLDGTVDSITGFYFQGGTNAGTLTTQRGFWYKPTVNSGTFTNAYGFYVEAMGGTATNPYGFWQDEAGVFRIKADNAFNSVYQAIPALYNPQFTKYTPGAANYERIVFQWESNVGVLTTEAGGTGTLRALRIGDTGVNTTFGGTVQPTGYKSSDGTAGATAGPFTAITAITVKNGLVTAITGT